MREGFIYKLDSKGASQNPDLCIKAQEMAVARIFKQGRLLQMTPYPFKSISNVPQTQ